MVTPRSAILMDDYRHQAISSTIAHIRAVAHTLEVAMQMADYCNRHNLNVSQEAKSQTQLLETIQHQGGPLGSGSSNLYQVHLWATNTQWAIQSSLTEQQFAQMMTDIAPGKGLALRSIQ